MRYNIFFIFIPGNTCPALNPPNHGSVLMPCIKLFGSTCVSKCSKGYYMQGSKTSECKMVTSKTKWVPDNATCQGAVFYSEID